MLATPRRRPAQCVKIERFICFTATAVQRAMECGICLERLDSDDELSSTAMSCCEHRIHDACLSKWCEANNSCPLCRAPVDIKPSSPPPQKRVSATRWKSKSGYPAVTRAHQCRSCESTQCITERPLIAPNGMYFGVSHYECESCNEIYDTYSRVPWT